jgi:hypothetical protein
LDAPHFLISFSGKFFLRVFFGPVGGLMFFGGKNHRANAPRINPRVFLAAKTQRYSRRWKQQHRRAAKQRAARSRSAGKCEQQIQIVRPKSEGAFRQNQPSPPVQISVQRNQTKISPIHPYPLLVFG